MAQGCSLLTRNLKHFIVFACAFRLNPKLPPRVSGQHALALPLLVPSSLTHHIPAMLVLLLFLKLALLPPPSGNSDKLFLLL